MLHFCQLFCSVSDKKLDDGCGIRNDLFWLPVGACFCFISHLIFFLANLTLAICFIKLGLKFKSSKYKILPWETLY